MSSSLGKPLDIKIKYIMVNCPVHYCDPVFDFNTGNINPNHHSNESCMEVIHNLKKCKYIGYSCIMITMNVMCECRYTTFREILKVMKENKHLRYKTKTIQTYYNIQQQFDCKREHAFNRMERFYLKYFEPLQNTTLPVVNSNFIYPNQVYVSMYLNKNRRQVDEDVAEALRDHYYYNFMNLDNTVLNQSFIEESSSKFKTSMTILTKFGEDIVQRTLSNKINVYNFYEIVQTSTNADLYFYNINPALAIIVNNYYFTKPHKMREGSDQDVVHLIRELKIKQIPYILIQDYNRKQLLEVFEYLKTKDFHPLKSFIFIMMSHGDSNNVIYTHDGILHIMEDIVASIQLNISLKEIEKFLVFINCRGPIHTSYADRDDFQKIHNMLPTDATQLDKNTVLLFSVPQLVLSPRSCKNGTPFVQCFRKHFRNMQHEDDVKLFQGNIEKDLKNFRYFFKLEKCTELVINDTQNVCHIIHLPSRTLEMYKLIQSILNDFPTSTLMSTGDDGADAGLFNICVSVNKTDISKNTFLNQYLAPKLDEDGFSSDEEDTK